MNVFFERLLRENPDLHEEIERFRQWGREELHGRDVREVIVPTTDEMQQFRNELQQAMIRVGNLFRRGGIVPRQPDPTITPLLEAEPDNRINPLDCRFYSGTGLLRCAVNPCATNCNGCNSFEPNPQ